MDRQVARPLERRPVGDLAAAEAARAIVTGFQDYFVPVTLDAAGYDARFRAEDVDPFASHVYSTDGAFVGVVLVARRGWTSRIAAMGIAKAMRGQGFGDRLLDATIRDARERGDRRVLLEVIAANARAIGLYRRHGFAPTRRLLGFARPAGATAANGLAETDPAHVAGLMAREPDLDLPWQLAAATLQKAVAPARGLALDGQCFALVTVAPGLKLSLRGLYVPPELRRRGHGARMLQALGGAFPDHAISTPVAVPEVLAPVFTAQGFQPIAIVQDEMALALR